MIHEIPTVFLVSKSENRNQVHYAVAVDDACALQGSNPMHAYWRMFEKGQSATEPLLERELPAYGIAWQRSVDGVLRVALRALPDRTIDIRTWKDTDGTCRAAAVTTVGGARARLFNVHLMLKFLGVDRVIVTGWADDGRVLRERLTP